MKWNTKKDGKRENRGNREKDIDKDRIEWEKEIITVP